LSSVRSDPWPEIPPLRLGTVPYLNVQPLVYGLAEACPSITLTAAVPRELDRMLSAGAIDLGIAPTFCAFTEEGRGILPAPSIASDGPVFSVLIVAREPLRDLRRVYRDPDSVTSNALTAILIRRCWGGRIELADLPPGPAPGPGDLPAATGRVLIGDPALRERGRYSHIVDLGQAWREWTGLPFVFAAWVGRVDVKTGGLARALEEISRINRGRLAETARAHDGMPDIALEERVRYLRENLSFDFGPRERQAIERYHAEAASLGLTPADRPVGWLA